MNQEDKEAIELMNENVAAIQNALQKMLEYNNMFERSNVEVTRLLRSSKAIRTSLAHIIDLEAESKIKD